MFLDINVRGIFLSKHHNYLGSYQNKSLYTRLKTSTSWACSSRKHCIKTKYNSVVKISAWVRGHQTIVSEYSSSCFYIHKHTCGTQLKKYNLLFHGMFMLAPLMLNQKCIFYTGKCCKASRRV